MKKIDIIPQGQKFLIKPIPKQEETLTSGIVIPDVANADLSEGEVISVGAMLYGVIKEGDVVLYPSKKGVAQNIGGEWYLWLDASPEREEVWGVKPAKHFQDKGDNL